MSSASSVVTYTSVYTDSEPGMVFWGADEELSDGGSPRVIVYGYDGLLMKPDEDEGEPMFIQPHDSDYVPESMYPEYIPLEDEHVLLAEEQPLPPVDSPIAESLGYVAESDPKEDPEEYKDDESEDGPVDYPIDWGDDGDDDDGNSSRDDTDYEDEEDEEEEEEENLAPADSAVVIPTIELVTPPEGTGPVIPLPSTDIATTGASIIVCLQASIFIPPEAEVKIILAMPTLPPSPLASLSPPSAGSALLASTQALIDAVTAALPSPPLPPPLYIPPPVGYGIRDTWVDLTEADPEIAPMNLGERVDLLIEDRIAHQETILIMKEEAYAAQEAWAHSIGLNPATVAGYSYSDTAPGTDGRDSPSDGRHETRDRGHYESSRRELDSQDRMLDSLITRMLLWMLIVTSRDTALTWWNSQIRSLGPDAHSMTWEVLKKKITNKYCPQGEIKKLEIELWNLKFKGNDVLTYTKRFQELTLICTKFVANETKKIEKYIRGLPDKIYGSVKSSKPKTLDETIELANDFMDHKLRTYVERQTNNKRKADDLSKNNHGHQQQPAKRSSGNTNVTNTQRDNRAIPKGNGCSECGASGHFKRDCPKLKNKDGGNVNAQGWVYTVGNAVKKGNV
nr:hypothetical protein [Tanacetum cinerariifolium]